MKRNDMVTGNYSAPSAREEEDMRHTIPGMMKKRLSMLLAIAFVVGAVMSSSSALAAERELGCGRSGFHGRLLMTSSDDSLFRDVRLYYRIKKGNNRGGNHANIDVLDRGAEPDRRCATDDGNQDNRWHYLCGPYNRGSGIVSVRFIFDKSLAPDPRCGDEDLVP